MDSNLFIQKLQELENYLLKNLRGELDQTIEVELTKSLISIFRKMTAHFEGFAQKDQDFPGMPEIKSYPSHERCFRAFTVLLKRLEDEFTQKMLVDFTQEAFIQVEIGKIQLSCLDGIHRSLRICVITDSCLSKNL